MHWIRETFVCASIVYCAGCQPTPFEIDGIWELDLLQSWSEEPEGASGGADYPFQLEVDGCIERSGQRLEVGADSTRRVHYETHDCGVEQVNHLQELQMESNGGVFTFRTIDEGLIALECEPAGDALFCTWTHPDGPDGRTEYTWRRPDDVTPGDVHVVEEEETKLAFVTRDVYGSDLGGLAGADAICQSHASAAGLAGTFLAWLSHADEGPSTRFTRSQVPYALGNGYIVAQDWDSLVTGPLTTAIYQDEFGEVVDVQGQSCAGLPGAYVWTNTDPDGTPSGIGDCGGWTGEPTSVRLGRFDGQSGSWTSACSGEHCVDGVRHLYCFEQ